LECIVGFNTVHTLFIGIRLRAVVGAEKRLKALKSALSESAVVCVVWGWFFGVAPTPPKGLHHHRRTQLLRSELFVPNFVLSLY